MTAFLCYADRDTDSALALHRALIEQRCRVWIDKLDIEGLIPVILNVVPVTDFPLLLGIKEDEPEYALLTKR